MKHGVAMVVGCCMLVGAVRASSPEEELAKRILADTGVKGGIVAHLGCGDGALTASLRTGEGFVIQGLDVNAAAVEKARARFFAAGIYGPVSAERWDGLALPYIDNCLNLIVAEDPQKVADAEMLRALAPKGVAYIKQGQSWRKLVKPRPEEMDEWTHYLHDPSNNSVGKDTMVGPPRHMQWLGDPRFSRHHDHMSSSSVMVSAGGRHFAIIDTASAMSIQLPQAYRLVARDAFNGTVLWEREIGEWFPSLRRLKSGPVENTRRLVAEGDRVYVTLGEFAPLTQLDAATGKTLQTYAQTAKTEELMLLDGVLYVQVNDKAAPEAKDPKDLTYTYAEGERRLMAIDAASGKILWNRAQPNILPLTLTVDKDRVLYCGTERIVSLDRKTGQKQWESQPVLRRRVIQSFFAPTMVLHDGVVLFSGGSEGAPAGKNGKPGGGGKAAAGGGACTLYAIDEATGKTLWTGEQTPSGYKSPEDILVVQGMVWTTSDTFGTLSGEMVGRDIRTGEVMKRFKPDVETHWFHHRCYRAKATGNFIMTSRTGIEFVDLDAQHWTCNHWVRGACLSGFMPANGMIYNAPHPCACYLEAKLYGFHALAPDTASNALPAVLPERLERGPAYDQPVTAGTVSPGDWPTYRADPARSGYSKSSVPVSLASNWETKLGGRLSTLTAAEGKVLCVSIDTHTVHALDAVAGKPAWSFTAGARIDSPPTIWQGRALFGCADGHVYCLRLTDGAMIWRFRAAPLDRRMGAYNQLESVWPVSGGVLLRDGEIWCVAGRSMFLDGGLRLVRLNPATGQLIAEKVMDQNDPVTHENLQTDLKGLNMPVALADLLSYDGKFVYMKSQKFDLQGNRVEMEAPTLGNKAQKGPGEHLFCPTGLLDESWWHRSYWVFGRVWSSGAGGYFQAGRAAPAGRPMVFNDTTVYGYSRLPEYYRWATTMDYRIFACPKEPKLVPIAGNGVGGVGGVDADDADDSAHNARPRAGGRKGGKAGGGGTLAGAVNQTIATDWAEHTDTLVRAMVLADKTLFVAGPPDLFIESQSLATFADDATQKTLHRQAAALKGDEGSLLTAVSTANGKKLGTMRLPAAPVFDGLIAAGGKLYMATLDGRVMCLAGK